MLFRVHIGKGALQKSRIGELLLRETGGIEVQPEIEDAAARKLRQQDAPPGNLLPPERASLRLSPDVLPREKRQASKRLLRIFLLLIAKKSLLIRSDLPKLRLGKPRPEGAELRGELRLSLLRKPRLRAEQDETCVLLIEKALPKQ